MSSKEFDDVQMATAAIAYYLYRQAGCPLGDSLSGLNAWLKLNVLEPFNQLTEKA